MLAKPLKGLPSLGTMDSTRRKLRNLLLLVLPVLVSIELE